jgi:hypothetical protein
LTKDAAFRLLIDFPGSWVHNRVHMQIRRMDRSVYLSQRPSGVQSGRSWSTKCECGCFLSKHSSGNTDPVCTDFIAKFAEIEPSIKNSTSAMALQQGVYDVVDDVVDDVVVEVDRNVEDVVLVLVALAVLELAELLEGIAIAFFVVTALY